MYPKEFWEEGREESLIAIYRVDEKSRNAEQGLRMWIVKQVTRGLEEVICIENIWPEAMNAIGGAILEMAKEDLPMISVNGTDQSVDRWLWSFSWLNKDQ